MRWMRNAWILSFLSQPALAQNPPRLFTEIFDASQPTPPRTLAAFPVDVDLTALAQAPGTLLVELPALGELTATRTRFTARAGGFDWIGKTAAHDIVLSVDGDLITGLIRGGSTTFSLVSGRNGQDAVHSLQRMNPSEFPADIEETDESPLDKASATPDHPDRGCFGKAGDAIDLLIVYSPEVLAAAGGDAWVVENALHNAVASANVTLDNSLVPTSIHLAHAALAPDSLIEERDPDDLANARTNAELAQWRKDWRADVVTYMTSAGVRPIDNREYCGVTRTMRRAGTYGYGYAFAPNAVTVVTWQCGVQNNDLSHEIAHNVGLDHNPTAFTQSTPAQNLYPFAFGHHVNGLFRDDMSGENAAQCPEGCPRQMFFSNPEQEYLGVPRGLPAERDNAQTYRRMFRCVSTFADYVFTDGYE